MQMGFASIPKGTCCHLGPHDSEPEALRRQPFAPLCSVAPVLEQDGFKTNCTSVGEKKKKGRLAIRAAQLGTPRAACSGRRQFAVISLRAAVPCRLLDRASCGCGSCEVYRYRLVLQECAEHPRLC